MTSNRVSLTSGMRISLLTLQGTAKLINRTQKRLSTGRKVNDILDNPTNFFASQAHLQRAKDLQGRKDSVTEAIQKIRAADKGIRAIAILLETATSMARAALGTSSKAEREAYGDQFDEILSQIDSLAKDSDYRGTNLLLNQSQSLNFSEVSAESTLTIYGFDATTAGLGVDNVADINYDYTSGIAYNIDAGGRSNLAIKNDGTVVGWGMNSSDIVAVPEGLTDVVAVAASASRSLALKSDGTVVAWGESANDVPAGLKGVVAVSIGSGADFSVALKYDGTVVAWGSDIFPSSLDVPEGLTDVVAIDAEYHTLALKSDGTVVAWGDYSNGKSNVPAGLTDVVAVAAGSNHSLALKSDGTVVSWGDSSNNVPAGLTDVVAISAGGDYSIALKNDGTVVAWGINLQGRTDVPEGLTDVVAISAGHYHSLALKSDGTIVAWGEDIYGQAASQSGVKVTNGTINLTITAPQNSWNFEVNIQKSLNQLQAATSNLRTASKQLSVNSDILAIRLDFMSNFSKILQTGAENLTLVDLNEESANLLMLQSKQQLETTSLKFGAQAAQSVINLF
ncbi:MAG: hypothetical protein PHO83_17235 [Geobacteraceae bacterium]|nr:hypothetical protein [Geobacteraceae bacterium]